MCAVRARWCVCLLCSRMADSFQEKLQGSTLYVLTIASVTIMPIQLMTGIFGMNFSYGDGTCPDDPNGDACPAMWELHWKHGYRAFWALGLALTGLVILAMHKKGIRWDASWEADPAGSVAAVKAWMAEPAEVLACRGALKWPERDE